MYILPVFKELFETNRRFTLTIDSHVHDSDVRDFEVCDSDVRDSDVCGFDVRDFDVRDCPKQLRTLRHCCDFPLPPSHAVCTDG
jgi:hypothetical protein